MGFISNLFGIVPCPADRKEEVNRLIDDLLRIGEREDYLSERPGGPFNVQCRHVRAIEIGKRLNQIGGAKLMEYTLWKVKKKLGKTIVAHLEFTWDEIGQWVV
ncbi:MAG TPA: hypothetical protein VK856_01860 [Anaerolineaceae bacterium]|nr:hypothetical protein [Anaerolineaceae bacterium]